MPNYKERMDGFREAEAAGDYPRTDGWSNVLTGLGTVGRDKTKHNKYLTDPISTIREVQEEIWEGDGLFARAVEETPRQMHRAGFQLRIDDAENEGAQEETDIQTADFGPPSGSIRAQRVAPSKPPLPFPEDNNRALGDDVLARYEDIQGDLHFLEAEQYERAYGGALMICGVNDGKDPSEPLDESSIKSFDYIVNVTPREAFAVAYYNDPKMPKYGQVAKWRIQNWSIADVSGSKPTPGVSQMDPIAYYDVHESRCILFPGICTSRHRRVRNRGFGTSILTRMLRSLEQYRMSAEGIGNLLSDFATTTFAQKGLAELLSMNDDDAVIKRAHMIAMTRSIAGTVLIDSEESYKRESTPVTGVFELMQGLQNDLAADADMPVSVLFKRTPSGMNANSDGELKFYYDQCMAKQRQELRPRHFRFFKLLMASKDSPTNGKVPAKWALKYNPLYQQTTVERAQEWYYYAQGDNLYVNNGTLTPEEVAASRFGGRTWSPETHVDLPAREELAKTYEEEKAAAEEPVLDPSGKPQLDQPNGPRPAGATPQNLNAGPKPVHQPLSNPRPR